MSLPVLTQKSLTPWRDGRRPDQPVGREPISALICPLTKVSLDPHMANPAHEEIAEWETVSIRRVSRDDIRRFAAAIGADDPVHTDVGSARAAGYRDVVAPAYFFCSLGLSIGKNVRRDELGADGIPLRDEFAGRRVVAGATDVEWVDDIIAGDEVTIDQRLAMVYSRRGKSGPLDFFVYERIYRRASEVLVLESYTRIAH
jgi:acyl dehydratase